MTLQYTSVEVIVDFTTITAPPLQFHIMRVDGKLSDLEVSGKMQ